MQAVPLFCVKIVADAQKCDFITMYIKNEVKYIIINIKDFLNPMFTSALLMLYLKISIIIMEKVFICGNSAFMILPQTPCFQVEDGRLRHLQSSLRDKSSFNALL